MKPLLIGLTGKAGAGKDTAGHYANRNHGFELYALSWPLKSGLEAMFDLSPDVWTREHKETPIPWLGKSPRELMQTLGTDWGRKLVRQDVWVRTMLHRWAMVQTMHPPRLCVMDVRFNDEADAIKYHDGHILRIVRPGVLPVSAHPSEAGIDDRYVDWTILNDGSPHELELSVGKIMERLIA